MTVELTKRDIMRLLRGTYVPYDLWDKMPKDLGIVQGGGWTDPTWHWTNIYENFNRYSEEDLFDLYLRIIKY